MYENNISYLFATFLHEFTKVFCIGPDRKYFKLHRTHMVSTFLKKNFFSLNMLCQGPQDYPLVQCHKTQKSG